MCSNYAHLMSLFLICLLGFLSPFLLICFRINLVIRTIDLPSAGCRVLAMKRFAFIIHSKNSAIAKMRYSMKHIQKYFLIKCSQGNFRNDIRKRVNISHWWRKEHNQLWAAFLFDTHGIYIQT